MSAELILKFSQIFSEAAHPRADYMRKYMRERYKKIREKILNILGNKCSGCGTGEGPFHLDHVNPKKKSMRAADLHSVNDKKFKSEVKKLQLLCLLCHKDKTKKEKSKKKV
jgi:5-methylcytosine-specific restriction endonuclease McrA